MKTRCIVLLILSVCYIFDSRYIFDGRAAGADPEELARSLRDRVVSVPDSVLGALDRIEAQKRPALRDYRSICCADWHTTRSVCSRWSSGMPG